MTGLGLAVAIPAVIAYNICVRQNRILSHDLQDHAHDLLIDAILQDQKPVAETVKQVEASNAQYAGGQA